VSPAAATIGIPPRKFHRVQNLETVALVIEGAPLASEGLALTGAWVDKGRGLISLISLEMGSVLPRTRTAL